MLLTRTTIFQTVFETSQICFGHLNDFIFPTEMKRLDPIFVNCVSFWCTTACSHLLYFSRSLQHFFWGILAHFSLSWPFDYIHLGFLWIVLHQKSLGSLSCRKLRRWLRPSFTGDYWQFSFKMCLYLSVFMITSTLTKFPAPHSLKHPHITIPPPCLTVETVFNGISASPCISPSISCVSMAKKNLV